MFHTQKGGKELISHMVSTGDIMPTKKGQKRNLTIHKSHIHSQTITNNQSLEKRLVRHKYLKHNITNLNPSARAVSAEHPESEQYQNIKGCSAQKVSKKTLEFIIFSTGNMNHTTHKHREKKYEKTKNNN